MWARYTSAEQAAMGAASNGQMPWTGQLYDIFQYSAAANTASLGGYADWRVPNVNELVSLPNWGADSAVPNTTAFPSWPNTSWIASSRENTFAYRKTSSAGWGAIYGRVATTTADYCALVRGGV